jgi:hypothetical protein
MIFAAPRGLLEVDPRGRDARVVCIDVARLAADASALDALARLALALGRCGYRLVLKGASPELIDLIAFAGLSQALPTAPISLGSTEPRC